MQPEIPLRTAAPPMDPPAPLQAAKPGSPITGSSHLAPILQTVGLVLASPESSQLLGLRKRSTGGA